MGKYRTSMSGGALEKYHLVEFSLRKFTSINELNHILSKIIIYVVKIFPNAQTCKNENKMVLIFLLDLLPKQPVLFDDDIKYF